MKRSLKYRRNASPTPLIERLIQHGWCVMLYDGDCVLCSSTVKFIADRSTRCLLAFCAMQSKAGREALTRLGLPLHGYETIIVLDGEQTLKRSNAALRLFEHMSQPWPRIAWLVRRLPSGPLDAIYRLVAKNRFTFLGRRDECMLLTESEQRRFIL